MTFRMRSLIVFIVTVSTSRAQILQFLYPGDSKESAISINDAPVGIYGKTVNPFGILEEYAASLSGAPVSIKGRQDIVGMQEQYAASMSDGPIAVYDNSEPQFSSPEKSYPEPDVQYLFSEDPYPEST